MDKILILDFGSQYTQLIARRVREMRVYCEIWPCWTDFEKIRGFSPKAVILSGGPASVRAKGSPSVDKRVFESGAPVLGICYGMQLMTKMFGGKIVSAKAREYGPAKLKRLVEDPLLQDVADGSTIWMSHGDSIERLPGGFELAAESDYGVPTVMIDRKRSLYALQFHPEVHHTEFGKQILKNFVFKIAGANPDWNMRDFIDHECIRVRELVGKDHVILGLSGGVDSSVAAVLIHKAIGKQLTCIFINNGLLRLNEATRVQKLFRGHYKIKLVYVDAEKAFLKALKGAIDPEKKRKIIGRVFVEVFEKEAKKIKNAKFLAQGTLYPDVIESVSFKGPSAVIKSHHNVGGLPKKMGLAILEPLRELFKDEVRELGRQMEMPDEILNRHPFPGPGLGIRILGEVTKDRLDLIRKANHIVMHEIKEAGWYNKVWQAFAVLLPVKSVGVMGDERTYENTCAVRVVDSVDGMTANWVDLPRELLSRISNRIINEVRGINRVVYDISSKPPATIEWE
jgi:GMP synthase (glutamine-hydrolysing)